MKPDICGCGEVIFIGTTLLKKKIKLNRKPGNYGRWVYDAGLNRILSVTSGTHPNAYEEHRPYCLKARK